MHKNVFAFSHFIHDFAPPFRRFNFAFYTLSVFALSHFRTLHFIRAQCRYNAALTCRLACQPIAPSSFSQTVCGLLMNGPGSAEYFRSTACLWIFLDEKLQILILAGYSVIFITEYFHN